MGTQTVISFLNLKGGVGKTALAVNFAAYCGEIKGLKTLLIDLDPQTNATFSTFEIDEWQKHAEEKGTVADLLGARRHTKAEDKDIQAQDVIKESVFNNVDLLPSHVDLFTIDLELAASTARERKLAKALRDVTDNYEIVVCDCPPNLTIPTQNALAYSTHYAVPIGQDYLSGIGIGLLIERVRALADDLDSEIELAGIIISRVGRRSYHRDASEGSIRQKFGNDVLGQTISERDSVGKASSEQKSIFDMNDSQAINEFRAVCENIYDRIKSK